MSEQFANWLNTITSPLTWLWMDEELRDYFLYRTNVSRWSRVACTIALCGIKFFYESTLKRDWTTIGLVKPKRVKSLSMHYLSSEW